MFKGGREALFLYVSIAHDKDTHQGVWRQHVLLLLFLAQQKREQSCWTSAEKARYQNNRTQSMLPTLR
jgi:hypothetical protein